MLVIGCWFLGELRVAGVYSYLFVLVRIGFYSTMNYSTTIDIRCSTSAPADGHFHTFSGLTGLGICLYLGRLVFCVLCHFYVCSLMSDAIIFAGMLDARGTLQCRNRR